jgi:hypothetical protein
MTLSADEITRLCDAWCTASITPEGGIALGGATEQYRLLANNIVFHELDYQALCVAILGTAKVLLRPGFNTFIDQDHFWLWAWCGELLLSPRAEIFSHEQHEIKTLFEMSIRSSLACCRKPTANCEEWEEQNRISDLQPHHSKYFLYNSHVVLAYLVFPLLEAVIKRACSAYVDFDGSVISGFQVPNRAGQPRSYDPSGPYYERQCSSLRDLLFLLFNQVAESDLRDSLVIFKSHLSSLDSTADPFDLIYQWRNQSLHGSTNFQTIGGTLLNLSLLIALSEIKQNFENHRNKILEHCRWEASSGHRSPWSFYPPY